MTDIEAMNATLRNMQEETEKLSRLLHCLLQAGMLMERLARVSGDLEAVLDQIHMHGNHMQHAALHRQPTMTMQQLYQQRKAALKRHRVEYERPHVVIDKTDDHKQKMKSTTNDSFEQYVALSNTGPTAHYRLLVLACSLYKCIIVCALESLFVGSAPSILASRI